MITLKFGKPGSGKTTILVKDALAAIRSRKYVNVYVNFECSIPGVRFIKNEDIGKVDLGPDSLLLIDEGSSFADSRAFMRMPQHLIDWLNWHRHFKCDVIIYNQGWDTLDRKIRLITQRVYMVKRCKLLPFISREIPVIYDIYISRKSEKKDSHYGEVLEGYWRSRFREFIHLLLGGYTFRPKYYRYFDSYCIYNLPSWESLSGDVPGGDNQEESAGKEDI